jgi:hypothetical protein
MTLVAAYRAAGIPVLLGDFYMSGEKDLHRGRKKICRVRPNLAIGWTGKLLQADELLVQMFENLADRPTKNALEDWLSRTTISGSATPNLKLAGWLSDANGQVSFLWDAAIGQVIWNGCWFIGSGGEAFEHSFAGHRDDPGSDVEPSLRTALETTVALLTQLNCTDRIVGEGNDIGVGGGYEALLWWPEEKEFKYVEKALYCVLACRLDRNGTLGYEPELIGDSLTAYRAGIAGENSVFSFSEGEGHGIWVMSAVGQPLSQADLYAWLGAEHSRPMDLSADYYGALLMFAAPTPCPPVPLVGCPWDNPSLFRGARGKLGFEIPKGLIEAAYRERRALFAESPSPLAVVRASDLGLDPGSG